MKLLPIEEARARMLQGVTALAPETVPLEAAVGRFLAQAVIAPRDQPPFDSSAMDGWAVRRADALNAPPSWTSSAKAPPAAAWIARSAPARRRASSPAPPFRPARTRW